MNTEIGKKIAAYRQRNGITIRQLAEETGLSSALLSQLERGLGNPTLFALNALAKTMDISLSQLVEAPIPTESLIQRKKDRIKFFTAAGQEVYDLVSSSTPHSRLEMTYMELLPAQKSAGGLAVHPHEEEIAFILEGKALIFLSSGENFLLEAGDSIRILPGQGHQMQNPGERTVQVLFARYRNNI